MDYNLRRQLIMLSKRLIYVFLFQLFLCTVILANTGNAQRKTIDQVKVSLNLKEKSLAQFFRQVESKTDFKFTYTDNLLDLNQAITVVEDNKSLYDVLVAVSKQTNLNFVQVNENIHVKAPTTRNKNAVEISPFVDIIVSGKVTDSKGDPFPGVSVIIEGTSTGTVTDIDGNYAIEAPEGGVLLFSFIGFERQRIRIDNQTNIDIILKEDAKSLEEVVVIGYGTVKKSDLTGSVASVKSKEINSFPTTNILQALSGRAAGVQVIQTTGAPGAALSVRIRGTNSIQGGNEPLYVVDGFPFSGNPTNLNNNDIESIEVLKDASATAIYGSRGANGVVLITTKQGKDGETRVDFETNYSVQNLRNKLDLMNAREYAEFQNIQARNDNLPLYFTQQQINSYSEGYDWQNLIFQAAPMFSTALNVSGGNSKTKFTVGGAYFGQEGIIKGSDFNRYSLRTNLNHKISDRLSLNFNTNLTYINSERRDSGGGSRGGSMIGAAISAAPISRPFKDDGSYNVLGNEFPFVAPDIINPINFINEQNNVTQSNVILSSLSFSYKITPDLTLNVLGGIENRDGRNDFYTTRKFFNSNGIASVNTNQFRSLLNETTLAYDKKLGTKHQFRALAGFTYQDFLNTSLNASGQGFLSDAFETYSLGAAQIPGIPGSNYSKSVLLSYLGRVNYSYSDKYLFTFSVRADGASVYSPENKWGYFPSGAFAWRVSEEGFLRNNSVISDFKIRSSWGITGSQAISPYATLNQLTPGNTVFDDRLFNTFAPSTTLPGDLKWETTEQIDLGFDIGFLADRFIFNMDFYLKNTKDLLNTVRLPTSLGFSSTVQNVGRVQNKGVELSLDSKVLSGKAFQWDLSGNISFNRNKVISLHNGEDVLGAFVNVLVVGDNVTILREGRPIGQFWGYQEDGYLETGRIKFKDLNGDGVINALDKTYIGDPNPDFIYGINSVMRYKNFEFNVFIQGSQGNDIFNVSSIVSTLDFGQGLNMPKEVFYDRWTPETPNAKYPLISRNVAARVSDRFVEDGSYLRFRNIQLAYNLPSRPMDKPGIRSMQIYVSAQNYITFTKYSWWDPEVNSRGAGTQLGIDHYSYPIPKTLTVGLRMGF